MKSKTLIMKPDFRATILQLDIDDSFSYVLEKMSFRQRICNVCTELKKKGLEFTTKVRNDNEMIVTRIK